MLRVRGASVTNHTFQVKAKLDGDNEKAAAAAAAQASAKSAEKVDDEPKKYKLVILALIISNTFEPPVGPELTCCSTMTQVVNKKGDKSNFPKKGDKVSSAPS